MDINQYLIYEKDTIDLAKSITIHSKEIARIINDGLEESGHKVDQTKPKSWKYYMNLNGDYHSSDPDPFIITSKDTLETIEFTKENLEDHPVTAASYTIGTVDYYRLVSRNVDSEMLIRGIVSPIEYEDSIEEEDYKILNYNPQLVENAEVSLIDELQNRVNGYFLNNHNTSYNFVDNLYTATSMAIFFINLPKMILNIRLKNCLTSEAHSFHIWSHLASYGNLDKWRSHLDDYQMRYLYRNIRWINENAGQNLVFEELTRVLLSRKGMPLYGYDMRHIVNGLPEQISPEILTTRYRIDQDLNVTNFNATKSVAELTYDIRDSARDNFKIEEDAIENALFKMKKSNKDRTITKVLESEKINEVENIELQVRELAYYHWAYLSYKGMFLAGIELEYPNADISAKLNSMEALALYMYCGSVLLDYRLTEVPNVYCYHVKKETLPTKDDLLKLKFSKGIKEEWINHLFLRQVRMPVVTSILQFNELCYDLRDNDYYDRYDNNLFSGLSDFSNSLLLTKAFWGNVVIEPPEKDYNYLFRKLSIDPTLITKENADDLMQEIFFRITGFDNDENGVSFLLKSLTELLSYLSSYNVQIIYNDDYYNLRRTGRTILRFDLKDIRYTMLPFLIKISRLNILKQKTLAIINDFIRIFIIERIGWKHSVVNKFKIDTVVDIKQVCRVKHVDRITITPIGIVNDVQHHNYYLRSGSTNGST